MAWHGTAPLGSVPYLSTEVLILTGVDVFWTPELWSYVTFSVLLVKCSKVIIDIALFLMRRCVVLSLARGLEGVLYLFIKADDIGTPASPNSNGIGNGVEWEIVPSIERYPWFERRAAARSLVTREWARMSICTVLVITVSFVARDLMVVTKTCRRASPVHSQYFITASVATDGAVRVQGRSFIDGYRMKLSNAIRSTHECAAAVLILM
jgi:hypothetical protein